MRVIFATDQSFDRVDRIRCVGNSLALGNLSDQTLTFVGKPDHAGRRAATLFIRHDLDRAAFEHRDATIRGS